MRRMEKTPEAAKETQGFSWRNCMAVAAATALIAGAGIVHGIWTGRWQPSQELHDAAARIDAVRMKIGDWQGEHIPVDDRVYQATGAMNYWMRRYRNRRTRQAVSVILMCGPAGPMSVHTPEVCYQGAGYRLFGSPKTVELSGDGWKAGLWSGDFSKDYFGRNQGLRLFWTWNDGRGWQAPINPRLVFGGQPYLYKLYVIRSTDSVGTPIEGDPAIDFLREALPALQSDLAAGDRHRIGTEEGRRRGV